MTRLETDRGAAGDSTDDGGFDRRWSAWLARGHARDQRSHRIVTTVQWLIVAGAAVALGMAWFR